MIHPHTRLQWIDTEMGYGVFATAPIPRGTITFVQDALDIVIEPDSHLCADPRYQDLVNRYAWPGGVRGEWILCWDFARFVNHCCHYTALTTAYGFEIAVRDIEVGKELTDDYGLLNLQELVLARHHTDCRGVLRLDDFDRYQGQWDSDIRRALQELRQVSQPLWPYLDRATVEELDGYLETGVGYRPVALLRADRPGGLSRDE